MVELDIPDKWISNILKAGGILIVLVMVGTLIRPSITGNVTNRMSSLDVELRECYTALNQTEEQLEDTDGLVSTLSDDVSNLTHQYHDCTADLKELDSEYANLTEDHESLRANHSDLQDEHLNLTDMYEDAMDDYESLADSMAIDTCCDKSPDVEYESYEIIDNSIVCRTEEKGDFELEC